MPVATRVVNVFGEARPRHVYLFANRHSIGERTSNSLPMGRSFGNCAEMTRAGGLTERVETGGHVARFEDWRALQGH